MSLAPANRLILAADVGGTNLNLALVARQEGHFRILHQETHSTQAQSCLHAPLRAFLGSCQRLGLPARPDCACISGAGPVTDRRILLTNVPWDIDGEVLETALGMPLRVINDFTAVAHGVLLLDVADPQQVLPLQTPEKGPAPDGLKLVVGAGTGLGVGFITQEGGRPTIHGSEGGHIGLPLLDAETCELWAHLNAKFPGPPGAEAAVSGPGLAAILAFLSESGRVATDACVTDILALPGCDQPAAISRNATNPACAHALGLFVDLYARVCAELSAVLLPTGGLFLAGGIAAKNAESFLAHQRFVKTFTRNYRAHLNEITRSTPVYIVRDYAISLYGAAHAACENV